MATDSQITLVGPLVSSIYLFGRTGLSSDERGQFVGILLVWALTGCIVIQVYDYHNTSRTTDRLGIKVLVYTVFVIEILHTALITHSCWVMLVEGWGNNASLIVTPWSSSTTPILNGSAGTAVQCFFSWRIWQMANSNIGRGVSIIIVLISLLQLGAATALTAETWLIASFIGDAIIAVAMVIVLRRARNKTAFKGTETLLNRLIVTTIETGAITAGFALVTLVLFKVLPNAYYFLTTEFILGKMYSNVLFATLNGRNRSQNNNAPQILSNFGTLNFGMEMNTFSASGGNSSGVVISTAVATDRVGPPRTILVFTLANRFQKDTDIIILHGVDPFRHSCHLRYANWLFWSL
ncbi:hypothetical protein C8R43DRAFT_962555 [Mycena crocata]|nr:hypothetical protein C8R43DRAFT_962555 [Mycena crocata]